MPFANVDGTKLYYEEIGDGEPLLLISGQGNDHGTWDGVRDDFAARYRVIVHDFRGTGQSDKPHEPPYTTRGFARDAIGILDHLGIRRAHAYGVSMGGRICQWLGIDHPDRIGGLVLGCTTPGNAHGIRRQPWVDAVMQAPAPTPEAKAAAMLPLLVSEAWASANPGYVAWDLERRRNPIPEHARRLHWAASEGHDSWDLLPSIQAPTLVIHGDDDLMNPTANAYLLAERIPGAELCIIPGGRHGFFWEFREEASRAVVDFLGRHPLGGQ